MDVTDSQAASPNGQKKMVPKQFKNPVLSRCQNDNNDNINKHTYTHTQNVCAHILKEHPHVHLKCDSLAWSMTS